VLVAGVANRPTDRIAPETVALLVVYDMPKAEPLERKTVPIRDAQNTHSFVEIAGMVIRAFCSGKKKIE